MTSAPEEITHLLNAWAQGDQGAAEKLFPLIERELHRIAKEHMRHQPPDHLLQTTGLVNEAYIKLAGSSVKNWENRNHFFAVASIAMRHTLVDFARKELRQKRGSGKVDLPLEEAVTVFTEKSAQLVALDEALRSFAKLDPRATRVVELRFFGGLSVEETAQVLGISPATVYNDWEAARRWLAREIRGGSNEP
jgi:RNA polymerase sigma-70 factor (ECF subfamily)